MLLTIAAIISQISLDDGDIQPDRILFMQHAASGAQLRDLRQGITRNI